MKSRVFLDKIRSDLAKKSIRIEQNRVKFQPEWAKI